MGFDNDKYPLPAPTESSTLDSADESIHIDDIDTNVSTNVSNRTDRTSYSVPDDGTPITINTTTPTKPHGGGTLHKKFPSQTSLLIEYFDTGSTDGQDQRRASVRVRITPSSRKSKKNLANDHIQISQASRNHRKPSSTRRISLASESRDELIDTRSVVFSDISALPPENTSFLPSFADDDDSDGGRYIPAPSDISSMPTDSMTGATEILPPARRRSRSIERDAVTDSMVSEAIKDTLKAPREQRSRSLSKDRITQRVMEKLQQQAAEGNLSSKSKERSSKSRETSRRRDDDLSSSRKSHRRRSKDVERVGGVSGTESSVLSSNIDRRSVVSGTSSINNPKLLATVEDAIKRLILPELNALKEENRTSRNVDKFERSNRDSTTLYEPAESTSSRDPSKRRVSKSSSTPKLHSNKPKVTLNRDNDDPAITLTGTSSRKSDRRSSRSSISSFAESTTREEKSHRRKSRDKEGLSQRESALLSLAGAGLTTAALKHHTSREEKEEERKHRKHRSSRSIRSRSESVSDSLHEEKRPKELVPPLPFNQSEMIGGSELTRDSILSAETETKERPESRSSASTGISGTGAETPLQQVPRGFASPSPHTPSRTPNALQQNLGSAHSNRSTGEFRQSTPKSERSYTSRQKEANDAGLSAAAAAKIRAIEQSQSQVSKYEIESDTQSGRGVSPIQSEASFRGDTTNTGSPRRFHSIRSGPSVSSLGDHFERRQSGLSIASLDSTASTKAARTRKRPQGVTLESKKSILNEPSTPTDTKEFFERNHKKNEQYRRELEENPLTPPPVNYNRLTQYTDDSVGGPDLNLDRDPKLAQDIRKVGSIPEYIHTPLAVESAVASLYDQTELSVRSSKASSPLKKSTLSQVSTNPAYVQTDNVPAGQRWAAIRDKAEALSQGNKVENSPKQSIPREDSPRQSIAESEDVESIDEAPRMHHSAFPVGQDDMPEIGYGLDDQSDVTTNPSIIQGPIGGGKGYRDHTDELLDMQEERERTPTSFAKGAHLQRHEQPSPATFDDERQPTVEDDYDHPYPGETQYEQADYAQSTRTPLSGQTGWKDEGYQSANHGEGYTPQNRKYSKMFEDDFGDDYDGMALGEDAFGAPRGKHDRQVSGNSHGIDSPLYDAATGKGIDHIQSKDIVALMDHLTVRDAQRNARDTEILVTLVRSAAEMRTQLDDLKQFIKVQDNMIMNTTDKRVNLAEQRILGGPRPQPVTPPRFNRNHSEEEIETKKKSVFRRALKGLSAGKGDGDIKHIEAMLVQLLGEVEGLKQVNQLSLDQQQQHQHQQQETARTNSMTSLENRRQSGDAGYEPEGRANTAESPNQSGYFSIPSSSRRIQDLHSGYDVGPTTRISTVREESDEEYDERSPGYENTERMTTPTQEAFQEKRASLGTPPQASRAARDSRDSRDSRELQSQENTPKRKHKSNSSSIFGIPKISRWSKTTASTNPESLPRNSGSGDKRPFSAHSIHSRSSSQDDYYDEEEPYAQHADDRLRSNTSLAREDQGSIRSVRSPSPLIPEENAYEMEDPKYQAHRNSLNLQHPQPRPGPTGRHQNNLETQAQIFQPTNRSSISSPDFDQWGSMPSLARNRLSGMSAPHASNLSPISSDGSYSQVSEHQNGSARQPKAMDDGPLMPPQQTLAGYGQTRQMYSSPNEFGSQGALTPLAPIAEVRYSLETDRGHRMTPTASSRASSASLRTMSDLSTPQRKITGPRAMGSRSPQPNSPLQHSDTVVRRKPIEDDLESLESYRSSLDSEIF